MSETVYVVKKQRHVLNVYVDSKQARIHAHRADARLEERKL